MLAMAKNRTPLLNGVIWLLLPTAAEEEEGIIFKLQFQNNPELTELNWEELTRPVFNNLRLVVYKTRNKSERTRRAVTVRFYQLVVVAHFVVISVSQPSPA